ncbi:MAG: secondary thiamine-phosphate synthase enzyme YjbQ [candidate division KSB1 bacterium]|nr:secondary thiamine-phosphate synthase enzyme YjbQ [candidate division KSB1 bacterium]MDZ7303999.1 secondary thiamine-phosphate synthase enzyme YjbQ [candidate division KSB1 bacterium]MDZ7313291.1 secondary thiamine-phosphate synthase enzyme YjbQ [candidate division KSB1 bacterium]
MPIKTERFSLSTQGFTDIHDITSHVHTALKKAGLKDGVVTVFVSGSTAGVTTIEYEPGLLKDLPEAFEKIAPMNVRYHHDDTWGDGNGYAHVRASLLGASLVVPFEDGKLLLGTWQQIVLVDFDNRPRRREVVLQFIGE